MKRPNTGPTRKRRALLLSMASLPVLALAACGTQIHPTLNERSITLRPGELEAGGLAFITPSTVTGQEQEKQAVALLFAEALKRERPRIPVVGMAETLGAINRAGLADSYKRMYDDHRDTALLERGLLAKIGAATASRYLGHLMLQRFSQSDKERFGALGFRIVETRYANVRLFLQIWDTRDGTIAWEGLQEMVYAEDRVMEQPVTLQTVIDRSARDLIARLP